MSFLGFNRYMVECEFLKISELYALHQSFNRYMVECEYHMKLIKGEASLVLIDTWWNVNHYVINRTRADAMSFNRYMVECESFSYRILFNPCAVLIDTWWNVNK